MEGSSDPQFKNLNSRVAAVNAYAFFNAIGCRQ
jgi:hypothetical protein